MVAKAQYQVYACSILPNHVHMVIGRHHYKAETIVRLLKAEATTELINDARWPRANRSPPSPWARKCWKVFLNSDADIVNAIKYVEDNPLKEGKAPAALVLRGAVHPHNGRLAAVRRTARFCEPPLNGAH